MATPIPVPVSIREQVMLAAVAAISAATAPRGTDIVSRPAGLTIHRERTRPIETDSLPAVMLYAEDDPPKTLAREVYRAPFTERQLSLGIECRAEGSASVSPDAALDPILVWTALALFADETLGGLANGMEEGRTVWTSREGNVPIAAAKWSLIIRFRTSRLDPTSKS